MITDRQESSSEPRARPRVLLTLISGLAREALVPLSGPKERPLTLISSSRLIVEGNTVGKVLAYDDPTTKRPADYFELYNSTGDLVAIGWFDRFGIRRMILDRGLLDGTDDLEGVFVFLVEGDSI